MPPLKSQRAKLDSTAPSLVCQARQDVASRLDYLVAYCTSALTLLMTLIAFRLAHQRLGTAGFAEFALMRRVTALLVPLLSIGLVVAIAKCVARNTTENGDSGSKDFLTASIMIGIVTVALFGLGACLFPVSLSYLCTGLANRSELVQAAIPLVAGSLLTVFGSAYFRGRMWFLASNALQLVCLGIIPLVVLLGSSDVETFLCWSGLLVCAVSGLVLLVTYLTTQSGKNRAPHLAARSLLRCGLPRVPGDLAYYGLLAAPALVAAHVVGIRAAGDFAYALTWLTLLSQLAAPTSGMQLPEAARLIYSGKTEVLRRRLQGQIGVMLPATCMLVVLLFVWSPHIIALHLGAATAEQLTIVRLLLLTAIPLNVFISLRSVIDAGESSAVSPGICLVAFAGFYLILNLLMGRVSALLAVGSAFLAAICLLAALAVVAVRRTLQRHGSEPITLHTAVDGQTA